MEIQFNFLLILLLSVLNLSDCKGLCELLTWFVIVFFFQFALCNIKVDTAFGDSGEAF